MKILIIGDIHIGNSEESTTQPGLIRQANSQAEATLSALIPRFNKLNFDLVVHMGDALKDTYIKKIDQNNTIKVLELLKKIKAPKIHLLGNHELRAFSLSEIQDVYRKAAIETEFFGVREFDHLRIIWLDLEWDQERHGFLPQKRIDWLKSLAPSSKTTLIFTHYSLVPIDRFGTYYFKSDPQDMCLNNANSVVEALRHLNPKLCINGHVHLLTHQIADQIHYVSAPSFSENITAENYPENNPGIFSILDIDENKFVFTTLSGGFCFSKIQGEL